MSRRGEVQFVAIRVGRSQDPRECLGLAHELKVEVPTALGYLALWEEMVLELGDARTGRLPKGYTAVHIAAKLHWPGRPHRLIEALKRAGVLATHKTVFLHPYWRTSTTGSYALERARLREFWRDKKARQRAEDVQGDGGNVPEMSPGTSLGTADIDQVTESRNGSPPAPPEGGQGQGAARWEWLREHHRNPSGARACIKYLDALPDEEWLLVQWLAGLPKGGGGYIALSKKRVLELDTHQLLAKQAYLRILPDWRAKLRRDREGDRRAVPRPVDVEKERSAREADNAQRTAQAAAFVLAQLADADVSEREKERIRERWRVAHPDAPAPWESPSTN